MGAAVDPASPSFSSYYTKSHRERPSGHDRQTSSKSTREQAAAEPSGSSGYPGVASSSRREREERPTAPHGSSKYSGSQNHFSPPVSKTLSGSNEPLDPNGRPPELLAPSQPEFRSKGHSREGTGAFSTSRQGPPKPVATNGNQSTPPSSSPYTPPKGFSPSKDLPHLTPSHHLPIESSKQFHSDTTPNALHAPSTLHPSSFKSNSLYPGTQPQVHSPVPDTQHSSSSRFNSIPHPAIATTVAHMHGNYKGQPPSTQGATDRQRNLPPAASRTGGGPQVGHHQQSASLPSQPPYSRMRRTSQDRLRPQSSDESLLRTPSSLAQSLLKPVNPSRTSLPASMSSQDKKKGILAGMFKTKASAQHNDSGVYEIWHPPETKDSERSRKKTRTRFEEGDISSSGEEVTDRGHGRVPPINVPIPIPGAPRGKSPHKVFTPFKYLTSKRLRTVSAASVEAVDGTAVSFSILPSSLDLCAQQPFHSEQHGGITNSINAQYSESSPTASPT